MKEDSLSPTPIPLIKRGMISGFINDDKARILVIDGINNPGFSGGPIVVEDNSTPNGRIVAVIRGYQPVIKKLVDKDGKELDNGLFSSENSGLLIAYDIEHAIEIVNLIK